MTENKKNIMREIKIEKVVLNIGGVGEDLEKGVKLLKLIVWNVIALFFQMNCSKETLANLL